MGQEKFLLGLALSLVLAMAIGSFALSETQANDTTEVTAGAFTISGEDPTLDQDYTFTGTTGSDGLLTIISDKEMTIKNTSTGGTSDRIMIDLPDSVDEANITLDGVNISTGNGAALEIADNATFNVTITLEDENILTSMGRFNAGLQKSDDGTTTPGTLTITGAGMLKATGGSNAAGIGGGVGSNGSYITISGGTVTANGGENAAGIGGGSNGSGSEINITDSTVTATGSNADYEDMFGSGAGIGGGTGGNGSKITITNSIVTATGGNFAYGEESGVAYMSSSAAIGGGGGVFVDGAWETNPGTGSENKIDDNSILIAKGGEDADVYSIATLEGFNEGLKGLVFEQKTDSDVNAGTVYGNIVLTDNLTIPTNATLTIPQNKSLTINASKTLTVPDGSVLTNDGTLTIKGTLSCTDTGKVETLLNYDFQGGDIVEANDDNHILYQDASGAKEYENLPEATKEGCDFDGWYTKEKGQGTNVENGNDILLNEHTLYANWVEPGPEPTPTPPGPEPGPTPEPTPAPSVDPGQDGDGGSSAKTSDPFMGGFALALLGVATTGAILTRKFK